MSGNSTPDKGQVNPARKVLNFIFKYPEYFYLVVYLLSVVVALIGYGSVYRNLVNCNRLLNHIVSGNSVFTYENDSVLSVHVPDTFNSKNYDVIKFVNDQVRNAYNNLNVDKNMVKFLVVRPVDSLYQVNDLRVDSVDYKVFDVNMLMGLFFSDYCNVTVKFNDGVELNASEYFKLTDKNSMKVHVFVVYEEYVE
ncbi:MAG: hypothetical protein ABIL69_11630 [candidate division WOR-3 bacterium]